MSNLYEHLVFHDASDYPLTVCGVSFSRTDLLEWASYNLQSASAGDPPSDAEVKNAWGSATAAQMDSLRDLIRGVDPCRS